MREKKRDRLVVYPSLLLCRLVVSGWLVTHKVRVTTMGILHELKRFCISIFITTIPESYTHQHNNLLVDYVFQHVKYQNKCGSVPPDKKILQKSTSY